MKDLYATITYAMLVTIVLIWIDIAPYGDQYPLAYFPQESIAVDNPIRQC
jgi:hypothetical protein